jgi:FkbM family methyltransferase
LEGDGIVQIVRGVKAQLRERFPGLAVRYKSTLRPLVQRNQPTAKLDRWVRKGEALLAHRGIEAVTVTGTQAWLREADGLEWLYLDGHTSLLSLKEGRGHEPAELKLLAERLAQGGTLFDIGANIGYFAVRLAAWLPALRVVAIEPVPVTYEALIANAHHNQVADRVAAIHAAATDGQGTVHVTVDRGLAGNHLRPKREPGTVEVPGVRVDDVTTPGGVTVIKCDVEGAELPVLRGAEQTLRRDRPTLLLEVENRWTSRFDYSPGELFDWLSGLGYRRQMVLPHGLEPSFCSNDVERTNSFWFH